MDAKKMGRVFLAEMAQRTTFPSEIQCLSMCFAGGSNSCAIMDEGKWERVTTTSTCSSGWDENERREGTSSATISKGALPPALNRRVFAFQPAMTLT